MHYGHYCRPEAWSFSYVYPHEPAAHTPYRVVINSNLCWLLSEGRRVVTSTVGWIHSLHLEPEVTYRLLYTPDTVINNRLSAVVRGYWYRYCWLNPMISCWLIVNRLHSTQNITSESGNYVAMSHSLLWGFCCLVRLFTQLLLYQMWSVIARRLLDVVNLNIVVFTFGW